MLRKIARITMVTGLVAWWLAAPAFAQGFDRSSRGGGQSRLLGGGQWWNNPEMIEALELDEETRQAIDDEVYRGQQEMITLRAEQERQELELRRVLQSQSETVELSLVETQVDRLVAARGAKMKEEILLRARVMALLSPEQRGQLEELFEERRQEVRDRARRGDRPATRRQPPQGDRQEDPPDHP